jgi:hypothetical protein
MSTPIPPVSPGDENPADDLKTDVIEDVEREHTITGDTVADNRDDRGDGA